MSYLLIKNTRGKICRKKIEIIEYQEKYSKDIVNSDYRKLGIAKELYKLLISFAKQQGYKKVTLRTFFKFVNAINFYEKMGFVKYNQDDESCFYMKML